MRAPPFVRTLALAAVTFLSAAAHAQPAAPPTLGPMPRQTVRRMGGFLSAMSFADLALALRSWVPDAQMNDIDQTSGDTPLTWIIGTHAPRPVQRWLVNRMIEHGAHANAADQHGWTPISRAIGAGDAELVRQLLARGVPASATWGARDPMSVLFDVCEIGGEIDYPRELGRRADVLLVMHRAGAPFDVTFGTAGGRPPLQGPIDRCMAPELAPIARLFALAGARWQVAQFAARNQAMPAPDPAALAALEAQLPDLQRADHARFFEAVARGDLRAATAALPTREQIDSIDRVAGTTPLTWVASQTRLATATRERLTTLVLDRGANVNGRDIDGGTALHMAVETVWPAGVRVLLARGATTAVSDRAGMEPAHNLCMQVTARDGSMESTDEAEIARLLVAAGANVNALGGPEAGYRRTPGDGCTNDNMLDRSAVRAVLGAAGGQRLRPVGLAHSGLTGLMPAQNDARVGGP